MQACLSVQRHSLTTSSRAATSQAAFRCRVPPPAVRRAQQLRVRAETEAEKAAAAAEELELDNPESESARKKAEADRLRAAEKFMVIGTGEATCKNCGYEYTPAKGDPEYPISKGTQFQQLPDDWQCPTCGAEKRVFVTKQRQVAGFAENQGYGLGTNSMDENQKSLLIFGGLAFFFVLLLAGYALP